MAVVAELPRLRRYARALLRDPVGADDLVQDCVERALSRLTLFRAGTNMRSWLFTIMHNVYVNSVRRRSHAPDRDVLTPGIADSHPTQPEQHAALVARDITRSLGLLSEEHREIVLLVDLEDMSYKQAAQVVGVPIGTVMSRLARGREHLRELMDGGPTPALRRVK